MLRHQKPEDEIMFTVNNGHQNRRQNQEGAADLLVILETVFLARRAVVKETSGGCVIRGSIDDDPRGLAPCR